MTTIKPKHQRLVLAGFALVAIIIAGFLAAWSLRQDASYFLVPSQLVSSPPSESQPIRLGGTVEKGSIRTMPDGVTVAFVVSDGKAQVPVRYTGILPDLFVEESGVVADGKWRADGVFVADSLLAKHDENYVPRELQEMDANQSRQVIAGARPEVTGEK